MPATIKELIKNPELFSACGKPEKLSAKQKIEIVKESKALINNFQTGLDIRALSTYLQSNGYKVCVLKISTIAKCKKIWILLFYDGSILIPNGADLKDIGKEFKNLMWTTITKLKI